MDAKEFLEAVGKNEAEEVAKRAGTNYAYYAQIAYGHRRPSPELAERLVTESGNRLDFAALLRPRPREQARAGE